MARGDFPRAWCTLLSVILGAALFTAVQFRPATAQTNPVPAEIVELARALKNNPDLIYEYVYNNIETLPQYGSLKGPLGALLDGKGTAFDQAELMVALLQQAGLTASFQFGQIQLTASQYTNWVGTDTSAGSVASTLSSGGFSGTVFVDNNGVVVAVRFGWAWVVVNIGGTNYVFDPSTKTYNRSSGVTNVASALGYSRSAFLADAAAVVSPDGTTITGLNRSNVRNDLATYANNLVQYIRTNSPAAATTDIIGGKTIVPLPLGTRPRQTTLPYAVGTIDSEPAMPTQFRTHLSLTFGSDDGAGNFTPLASQVTFNTSDIYGHRLIVSFDSTATPSLLIDGVSQFSASGPPPAGRQLTIRTSISHPYPSGFANVTNNDQMRVTPLTNFIYLIGTGWGTVGRGIIEKHRKLLLQQQAQNPGNSSAEPVLGESLAMLGYTWLAEISRGWLLADQLAGTNTIYHHAVGIVGTKQIASTSASGPYVDLPLNALISIQRAGRPNTTIVQTPIESSAFFAEGVFASIAESGSIEQTQPGLTAVSTVKLVDIAIQTGSIFDINNNAVSGDTCAAYQSTIRPQMQNYSSGDLARIDSLVGLVSGVCQAGGLRVIAPANGQIGVNLFQGAGYFQIAQDNTLFGAIISGGLSGGEPTFDWPTSVFTDDTSFTVAPPSQTEILTSPQGSLGDAGALILSTVAGSICILDCSAPIPIAAPWAGPAVAPSPAPAASQAQTQVTGEPINLVTGDYLSTPTDLAIGSRGPPHGLTFQRYYDSGTYLRNGPLGFGWTHSFAFTALTDSDCFEGMGINSPINGAAAIAAMFVTLDILNNGANADGSAAVHPLDRIVIASVAQNWLMEQLTNNIVAVTQPGVIEHFTKLADGSFNPPLGSATTLTFGNGVFSYMTKDGTTLAFNGVGNLATWSNPAGATTTLTYDSTPLLTSVSNNLGRTLLFTYAGNFLTRVSDDSGRSVSYGYDASGNLASFTDPAGNTTTYKYDLPGRITQVFYPANPGIPFVTNTYDSLGRVMTQANANNSPANPTIWRYFLAGSRSEEVDSFGTQHVIYVTPRGKTVADIQDLQGLNRVTTNTYDGLDRLTRTTAPEGNSSTYAYDAKSNVLSITATPKPGSPLAPRTQTFTYEPAFNHVATATDPLALVTTYSYEPGTGNLVRIVRDSGAAPHLNAAQTFRYIGAGLPLAATDPLGVTTLFGYDNFGNVTSVTRDFGPGRLNQVTRTAYDTVGNVIATTDPNGNTVTAAYDSMRRVTTTTLPAGAGNLTTTTVYDASGQILQSRQSAGGQTLRTTSVTYTLSGKPATATDALGNRTLFTYDALDRANQITDPAGRTTTFTYDTLGRLTQLRNPAIQAAPLEQHAYTPNGREASFTDALGHATSYTYDGFDRLARATYPDTSFTASTYDADDNVLTRTTRAGQTISFAYDTLNRLVTKTPPSPSPVVTYSYDLAGRATGARDTSAAIASVVPPSGNLATFTTTYAYDQVNRRTGVTFDNAIVPVLPAAASVTFQYAYNAVNQRTTQTLTDNSYFNRPAGPSAVVYAANNLNQYTTIGAVTPTYDGNGNLTFDGTFTYGYDAENRLVSASGAGNSASYTYDGLGRRKTKTVNGRITVSVGDGRQEILDYDGTSGTSGQILTRHVYGVGLDEPVSRLGATGARVTLIPDVQGSIIASIDATNGTIAKTPYQSFGESGDTGGTFRYTGRRIDDETNGLYYYRARMYSPAIGRFLQPDPIGYQAGRNLYAYVGNDPLNFADPEGLFGIYVSYGATGVLGSGNTPAARVTVLESGDVYLINGVVATAQAGAGVFFNGPSPSVGGIYTRQLAITGLTPSGETTVWSALPTPPSSSSGVLGGSISLGRGLTFTNANDVSDLSGPSHVTQLDLGLISIQYSTGTTNSGNTVTSVSLGATLGFGLSTYDTQSSTIGTQGATQRPAQTQGGAGK